MTSSRSTRLPSLLLVLAACSAGAPTGAVPPTAKGTAAASRLAAAGDLRGSVHLLTTRAPENLDVSDGPLPGSRVVRVRQGYGEVMLAKTNSDGTVSTRCVDSPEGADAFLNETTRPTLAKAAQ
jgi:hypothetical protein